MTEYQWGVRTVYTDGSGDIEWMDEDEARSFLSSYADYDAEPMMRVKSRELVRRVIVPGEVEIAESNYGELRRAADGRVGRRQQRTSEHHEEGAP